MSDLRWTGDEGLKWCGDETHEFKIVDQKLVPVHHEFLYATAHGGRRVTESFKDGVLLERAETEWRRHGLRRVADSKGVRHYWHRVRVPWIVWAIFS